MAKFLVTGGAGFIGSALVLRLLVEGHEVRVLDNLSRSHETRQRLWAKDNYAEIILGDIRNSVMVAEAVKGVDTVVHLAAINGTEFFYSKPGEVVDVGVRGFLNILDACDRYGVGDLVIASSSEVYQTAPVVPTDETAPLTIPDIDNPRYSYGGAKIFTELMARWCCPNFDRVTVFRPHNVYGPAMGWEHVIPQFVLRTIDTIKVMSGGPIPFPIQGDGTQTRAFMHIDDCIDAIMLIIAKAGHHSLYHIGNPEEVTIASVAEQVVACFGGRKVSIEPSSIPSGGTLRRCPDISQLRKLGFEPKVPFKQGLPEVVGWYTIHSTERAK